MATYAIIADVHGNLEALEVVLDYIHDKSPDVIVSLGDIVGYGPNPKECLDIIDREAHVQVVGNWDYAIFTEQYDHFNKIPKKSLLWTMNILNNEDRLRLGSHPLFSIVPFFITEGNAMFVHGSPRSPLKDYVSPDLPVWTYNVFFEITNNFADIDFLFLGHTHKPLHIKVGEKNLFNPGSVGQPRDKDPRASFMFINIEEEKKQFDYELVRLNYDIATTQEKMRELGMHPFLIKRLEKGI
ncbi:MAG: metallophosphoesterase family protein [Candidatus Heimdallarchaeaceae archaeon]